MRSQASQLVAFAGKFGRLTKGSAAGQPLPLEPFQKKLLTDLANSGARRAYIQLPRKNGKSMLGAVLALHGLCADGEQGSEVYSVASTASQARLVFNDAKRMVELGPLSSSIKIYQHHMEHKPSGSFYRVLSSEASSAEGLNPHLVIFDELHAMGSDDRLWNTMNLGSGTREAPLVIAITTPGVRYGTDGRDSVAFILSEKVKRITSGEEVDPSFFGRIWEPSGSTGVDVRDREAWYEANPGLGVFLNEADMESAVNNTPENEFKTKRLGLWVSGATAWLPAGAWDKCSNDDALQPGRQVILGFDGSFSRDATALVGATIEENPQVFVVKVWEKPINTPHDWQVDREDVTETLLAACNDHKVKELIMDTHLWVSESQEWEKAGVNVVQMPQGPARMVPATQRFYEAVTTEVMRHDGNPILSRHVGAATIKPNHMIAKEHKDSGRKIDAAVAAVMAYDRAAVHGKKNTAKAAFVGWI